MKVFNSLTKRIELILIFLFLKTPSSFASISSRDFTFVVIPGISSLTSSEVGVMKIFLENFSKKRFL